MQLHVTEKERLTSSSVAYEGMPSPRLTDYLLNMDMQTNNNTKAKKEEEAKSEEGHSEENFTRMNSEIHKLFRPIDF